MERSDREMVCVQCGQSFKFTSGEQDFYLQNQLQEPKRCKGCRGKRTTAPQGREPSAPRDTARAHGGHRDNAPRGFQTGGYQPGGYQPAPQPGLTSHANYGNSANGNTFGQGQGQRRRGPAQPYRPAAADDPNGYRSPGFQDAYNYQVDYSGLPKDDEADDQAAMLGNSTVPGNTGFVRPAAQSARPTRNGHPRGMNGRQPDRSGTDPDAYRSPGFARAPNPASAQSPSGDTPPGQGRKSRQQRPRFETVCAECGAPAVVPFQPAEDRPAFCKPCYQIKKPLLGLGPGKTPKAVDTDASVVSDTSVSDVSADASA